MYLEEFGCSLIRLEGFIEVWTWLKCLGIYHYTCTSQWTVVSTCISSISISSSCQLSLVIYLNRWVPLSSLAIGIFIANFLMVAVGLEAYIRGLNLQEHCYGSFISVFLLAQILIIFVMQIIPQFLLVFTNKLLSPGVAVRIYIYIYIICIYILCTLKLRIRGCDCPLCICIYIYICKSVYVPFTIPLYLQTSLFLCQYLWLILGWVSVLSKYIYICMYCIMLYIIYSIHKL